MSMAPAGRAEGNGRILAPHPDLQHPAAMTAQEEFRIDTPGRGLIEITRQVAHFARGSGIRTGLCNVLLRHTSASLILSENPIRMC